MKLKHYTASDHADAQRSLLPPGAAFNWPLGGFGDALLKGIGAEFERIGAGAQQVMDAAIEQHRPKYSNWNIGEYRLIANEAIAGVAETMPRNPMRIGSKIGGRLWSSAATRNFPVPLLRVEHLLGPCRIGSKIGSQLWSKDGRFVIRVRYYHGVVDPKPVWDALAAFKQDHVFLWFEDITGAGGSYGFN